MFDLFLDLVGALAQGMEEGFRTIPKVSGLYRAYSNFLKVGDFQFGLHTHYVRLALRLIKRLYNSLKFN